MGTEIGNPATAVRFAAEWALAQWMRRLGTAGIDAMRALPALSAQVDQHAAEIRDAVADRHGRIRPTRLAAYADGVCDTATARGWSPAEVTSVDWATATWPSVRLLAVCVLAQAAAD